MAIEPSFEKIYIRGEKSVCSDNIKAECKTGCESSLVKKVLSLSAKVFGLEREPSESDVKYGGKIVFYFCYVDESGAIKKIECANEFTGSLKCEVAAENAVPILSAEILKTEWDVSGANVVLSAVLKMSVETQNVECKTALSGGEGLITDKSEQDYCKTYGVKKTSYPVEAQFELNYPVAEVLSQKVEAAVTQAQAGVGCIIVDGEVFLSALILPNREKSDIIRENKSTGFRLEIECDDAIPKMQADARVSIKNFKTDVSVDAESGKSEVNFIVTIELFGECFSKETAFVATDAFSTERETQIKKENYRSCVPESSATLPYKLTGRANIDEIPVSARITAVCEEKAEITSVFVKDGSVKAEGAISARIIFKDGEGECFSRYAETVFEKDIISLSEGETLPQISVIATCAEARIVSGTEIELSVDALFTVKKMNECSGEFIGEVISLEEKVSCDKAISVYFGIKGEGLWSLSKRLSVCPEELIAGNKELQFPLSGEERIVIYRQK